MLIVTDVDPASPGCPDPETSWASFDGKGGWRSVLRQTFPPDARLFVADHSGAKLSREFPLIVWRREARESQVDLAMRLASRMPRGARSLVLVAVGGTAFRGHHDRRWECAPGNLHATVALRENPSASHVGMGYAILPVLAIADAVASLAGSRRVGIKWINDILLDGAKVGGAIGRSSLRAGEYDRAVFGMGLNTLSAPAVEPTAFVPRVASLKNETAGRTPLSLLTLLLSSFASGHALLTREGGVALARRYRELSCVIGREVRLCADGPGRDSLPAADQRVLARGIVEAIGDGLELLIGGERHATGRLAFAEDFG